MTLTSGTSRAFPVFVQGLALSLGLIVAIGAQNALVLCQGLRRKHAGSVVLFCAVADAVLIAAGVLGMARAAGQHPELARAPAVAVAPWFGLPRARQVLDGMIGVTMFVLSALLPRHVLVGF